MAIGERMRWFRNAVGMTQKELGKLLGFSERTAVIRVGHYENEKRGGGTVENQRRKV